MVTIDLLSLNIGTIHKSKVSITIMSGSFVDIWKRKNELERSTGFSTENWKTIDYATSLVAWNACQVVTCPDVSHALTMICLFCFIINLG